ncbi:hypothetical protein [Bacillus thuringiensis]|uniref:Group-specific protein n=1 Tax=Bacillus thuringiensis TaxID=1428 RepID=A0ABD6R724_BACTU|nr:hypothetical protein [Bacillus thuringiensis]OPD51766.1 hypothetical protein BVF97_14080 [Bacillus thuringiensis]
MYFKVLHKNYLPPLVDSWYITEPDLWYVDYDQAGYAPSEYREERKGIRILNETTIANFLERIEKYERFTEDIRLEFLRELRTNREEAYYDYNQCFFIDFDRLIFYSTYPESISFEEYIPNKWEGYLQRFDEQVLYKYRYWEDKNKNYLVRED